MQIYVYIFIYILFILQLPNCSLLLQVWNITEALKHIYRRVEEYHRFKYINISNGSTSVSFDDNDSTKEYDPDYWSDVERKIPIMSGKCLISVQ